MDKTIKELLDLEGKRQNEGIELIASENYPSKDIRDACGSIAIAKYAEGYLIPYESILSFSSQGTSTDEMNR